MVRRQRGTRRDAPGDLVVVGLGNPGDHYASTRHNVGVWVLEDLVERYSGQFRMSRREKALTEERRVGDHRLLLVIPTTFYNESGRAVAPIVRRFGLDDLSRLVVVHDELDLPVGRMKLKLGGGMAGNNGLKSIRDHLRSDEFVRIRIGIGKPDPDTMKGRDYVLKRPLRSERPHIDRMVTLAADAVEYLLEHDLESTMNKFNVS